MRVGMVGRGRKRGREEGREGKSCLYYSMVIADS